MKRIVLFCLVTFVMGVQLAPIAVSAGSEEIDKVQEATAVLREIMAIPEKSIPPSLLKKAYGVAVIPHVIKAGFVVGGRYGKGIVVVQKEKGKWSPPSFLSLAGGSVGWQIGVQSTDVILVFKNRKSIDKIASGKVTLGADASIAAGPVGRTVSAGTDIELKSEIYSYSRSRGLFAGVALEGAVLNMDYDANRAFYGKSTSPYAIFGGEDIKVPASAKKFIKVLAGYSK